MKNKFLILLLFVLSSVCSAQEFKKDGLKYRVIGSGNDVEVIDMVKEASEVIIPGQVAYKGKNYNVKAIGYGAFYDKKKIMKVVIPDNVTDIGTSAFFSCTSLEHLELPSTLQRIGHSSFRYCEGLKEIVIPDNVTDIEDFAFHHCTSLEHLEFPSTLQRIGSGSFGYCEGLKEIAIPDNVTIIGSNAFFGCRNLQRIKLPSNLQSIGEGVFSGSMLREIERYKEFIEYDFSGTPFYNKKIGRVPQGASTLRIAEDGTISYAMMPFSSFLKPKVEAEINTWQKKGEFESTEKWKARVNETTREAKVLELTEKYKQEYQALAKELYALAEQQKKEYYVEAEQRKQASIDVSKLQLSAYDADNESFMVTGLPDADILLAVNVEDAPSFKQNWETIRKSAAFKFVPNGEDVAIVAVTFTNGEKEYTYDGNSNVKYGVTDVEYKFKPLELAMEEEEVQFNFDALDEGAPTTIVKSLAQNKAKVEHKKVSVGGVSDVDETIPNTNAKNSNTFAVIIGNENYQKVAKVQFARNDARIFAQYCKLTLGLPEKNIRSYNDATYATLLSAVQDIKNIAQAYKGNLNVLFYYAGHGVPNESSNDSYLLPIDTDGRNTIVCYPLSKLYEELGSMNAQSVIVFMDACFSGAQRGEGMLAAARGVAIEARPAEPQGNMVVFSAASGDETAYPYKEQSHGMFTYFLLKKLQETKGAVTLGDLGNYIIDNVTKESVVSNGKSQTPTVTCSEIMGADWRKNPLVK